MIKKSFKRSLENNIKTVKLPSFFFSGQNIIKDLYKIFRSQNISFKKAILLVDKKTFSIGGNKILRLLKNKDISIIKIFIKKSDYETVKKIVKTIKKYKPDLIIGFGGGKILDVAKISAGMNHIRFISIPTILSNDGIASPVSVITNKDGIPISHLTSPPFGIIIDFDIIKRAPLRHLRAGVGDLISNLSAVFDCYLACKKKAVVKKEILRLAEVGAKGLLRVNSNIRSKKFLELLCDGLLKSGLSMCLAGSSRPASGSEHKISHSMDYLFPGRDVLHGEQVGIATLFVMALQKNPFLKAVKRLFKKIKFPIKLSSLKINPDDFVQAVMYAKKFRPWRYTILEERKLDKKKIEKIIKDNL